MAGHEVTALFHLTLLVSVNLGASEYPVGKACDHPLLATDEASDIVAKSSVPFFPTVADETAHLVKASCIPGFGDELCARESGVRLDVPEHGRRRHGVAGRIARKDRRKIKPEPVNMHLADPIA